MMTDILKPQIVPVQVNHDGVMVQLIVNGKLVFNTPWQHALAIGNALVKQARLAEEIANHEQVARQQAAFIRAGIPIGLVRDPRIAEEAKQEAQWNSTLRKNIPDQHEKNRGIMYAPTVRKRRKSSEEEV